MKKRLFLLVFTLTILIPLFAWYSYWLVVPTVNGDAESYKALYDALSVASLDEVRELGVLFVSSREFTPYVLWIGATLGIDKNIYITFFNIVLLSGIFLLTIKRKLSLCSVIVAFLMVTNFYIVVLMTSAERLKFAYILLVFAALSKDRTRVIFFLSSLAMHFQTIILIFGQFVYLFSGNLKDRLLGKYKKSHKINKLQIIGLFIILIFLVLYFKDALLIKATSALDGSNNGVGELAQLFLLFCATIPLLNKRFESFSLFVFYGATVFLIGGSRVNMIAFTSIFYIALSEGAFDRLKARAIPFYLILIYLSFKSIGYIERTFIQGHGWSL